MIGITKSATPPAPLTGRGATETAALCAAFDAGVRDFTFKASIYGHPDVKRRLIEDQHGKCCFCESKIGADGDVEHYRPKAAWRQGSGMSLAKPGYYWLAYDWANLLLCCTACNQRFKGNLFPLRDPTSRATNHHESITKEEAIFLDPNACNPEDYIGFRQEIPYAIDGNSQGTATIENLGLAREILNERRRDRLGMLNTFRSIMALANAGQLPSTSDALEVIAEARQHLLSAVMDTAEFTSMARSALQ